MDPDNLTSWRLKIARAKEHFGTLDTEITAWVGTRPIAITKEKDAEGRCHTVFAEVVNPPALNRWSLISGDCVHNLRSALDSLLYGIAIHETGLNPPPNEKAIQFPITSSPDKFSEQKSRIKLFSATVQSEIEKVQPYNEPQLEFPPALDLLGTLNNLDKHRTLNVMAAVPQHASVEMEHSLKPGPSSIRLFRTSITDKTEILSFTMEPPDPDLVYKCTATILICVAHPPGPSKSPFSELARVLHTLIQEVERIVNSLETIVGEIRSTPPASLTQSAEFKIDENGLVITSI